MSLNRSGLFVPATLPKPSSAWGNVAVPAPGGNAPSPQVRFAAAKEKTPQKGIDCYYAKAGLLDKLRFWVGYGLHSLRYAAPSIFAACVGCLVPLKRLKGWVESMVLYKPYGVSELDKLKSEDLKKVLKDVFFKASDGVKLHGWYAPAKHGMPTVIYSHGNFGNMNRAEHTLKSFVEKGYGMLAYDYRGFGKSEGISQESGLYKDLEGASHFLATHAPHPVPVNQQIAMGESIGTAVSADAATRIPFKAVILAAAPTSIPKMISTFKSRFNVPGWILPLEKKLTQKFDTESKIGNITSPVLVVHGTKDNFTPLSMGKTLYSKATKAVLRRFVPVKGGLHSGLFYNAPEALMSQVDTFLKKAATLQGAKPAPAAT